MNPYFITLIKHFKENYEPLTWGKLCMTWDEWPNERKRAWEQSVLYASSIHNRLA